MFNLIKRISCSCRYKINTVREYILYSYWQYYTNYRAGLFSYMYIIRFENSFGVEIDKKNRRIVSKSKNDNSISCEYT